MNFCSDNTTGMAPAVLAAVAKANDGAAMPYGDDPESRDACARIEALFETDCTAFLVATGTAANSLALAQMTPPYGAVYCHEQSHVNTDECGAPEFYSGGAKLIGLPGEGAKFSAETLAHALANAGVGDVHHTQPSAVSLTNLSEMGQVYAPDEVAAICAVARAYDLPVHMDGARFANAVASLGCAPADLTWRAGVSALSFGGAKNGCMAAEAVVFFDPGLTRGFEYRRKRAGHLWSKARFIGAQFQGYLDHGLWLDNARHANAMAARLAQGLARARGCRLLGAAPANQVFATIPEPVRAGLRAAGFAFYGWPHGQDTDDVRLVTAFNTDPAHVDAFLDVAERLGAASR